MSAIPGLGEQAAGYARYSRGGGGGRGAEQTAKARASIWSKDEAHDLRGDRRHWPATPGAGRRRKPRRHRCRTKPRQAVPAGAYVTADLTGPDPAALESAGAGADAVLSGLLTGSYRTA